MQVGYAPRLVKKASQRLLIELVKAQYLERHDTAERCRFAYLVHMAIAARTNERDDFVAANMRSLYEKITARAGDRIGEVLMPSTWTCIQTTGQLFYLYNKS